MNLGDVLDDDHLIDVQMGSKQSSVARLTILTTGQTVLGERDPITEFFNHRHDPHSGKFVPGGSSGRGGGRGASLDRAIKDQSDTVDLLHEMRKQILDVGVGKQHDTQGNRIFPRNVTHTDVGNAHRDLSKAQKHLADLQREKRLGERETRLQKQHKTERKAERRRKVNTVINSVVAATAVVGLLLATGVVTQEQMQSGAAKARSNVSKTKANIQENIRKKKFAKNMRQAGFR